MGILIADSGGSTTDWAYINESDSVQQCSTPGMNPNYTSVEMQRSILKEVFPNISRDAVFEVHMYSAGSSKKENKAQLRNVLEEKYSSTVEIHTDLLASARALFGKKEGIACILGTGSNAGYFNGEEFTIQSPTMGYLLDDPGSGFHIGKQLLKDFFYGFIPADIEEELHNKFPLQRDQVLENFYKQLFPNRYVARFCSVLADFKDTDYVKNLVGSCFIEFIDTELHFVLQKQQASLGFTGSVAYGFKEILESVLEAKGLKLVKVLDRPIEGLIEFHSTH